MKRATYTKLKRTLATLVSLPLIILAFYVYFRTGFFSIRTYAISGAPEEYRASLEKGARLVADNTMFLFLPGNRVVSYHDDELRTLIMETLPNTKDITIYPSGLHTLTIKITPHVPLFAVSDTHAIAEDGTVYKEIIPLAPFARIELATSSSVHPKTLRSIAELVDKVHAVLFEVRYVAVDEHNDVRLYDNRHKSAVIVRSDADMDVVWSNLLSAIDTDPLKAKLAHSMNRLEYIDTRFGNKVFYKFTNGETPGIIPAHDTTATTTLQ